jgi:hypothetical protein
MPQRIFWRDILSQAMAQAFPDSRSMIAASSGNAGRTGAQGLFGVDTQRRPVLCRHRFERNRVAAAEC